MDFEDKLEYRADYAVLSPEAKPSNSGNLILQLLNMHPALRKLNWVLGQMRKEALKRHAPVLEAESKTRGNPFKILVFTMLSARTKDATTLRIVTSLFSVADTPSKIVALGQKKLEQLMFGVGFYKVKAKNLIQLCKLLSSNFHSEVPDSLDSLLTLPGVGRKTANIVLARAFGQATLGVDVHVHRVSNRLGVVRTKKPEDTETALVKLVPETSLRTLNRDFVSFGQTVCGPRKPLCSQCPIRRVCMRVGVTVSG